MSEITSYRNNSNSAMKGGGVKGILRFSNVEYFLENLMISAYQKLSGYGRKLLCVGDFWKSRWPIKTAPCIFYPLIPVFFFFKDLGSSPIQQYLKVKKKTKQNWQAQRHRTFWNRAKNDWAYFLTLPFHPSTQLKLYWLIHQILSHTDIPKFVEKQS